MATTCGPPPCRCSTHTHSVAPLFRGFWGIAQKLQERGQKKGNSRKWLGKDARGLSEGGSGMRLAPVQPGVAPVQHRDSDGASLFSTPLPSALVCIKHRPGLPLAWGMGCANCISSKTRGPGEHGAAGYCPRILLLNWAKCLFHRSYREIRIRNRPISETKFLDDLWGPFSSRPLCLEKALCL